jgi:hypothetical protein
LNTILFTRHRQPLRSPLHGFGLAYFEYGTSSLPEHAVFQPNYTANAYSCEDSIKDELWRTLTGDLTLQGHPAPDQYVELLNLPLRESYQTPLTSRGARAFSQFTTQNASLFISGRRLDSFFTNSSNELLKTVVDAVKRIWRFTRTHRLVITLSGKTSMAPIEARIYSACSLALIFQFCYDQPPT